MRSSNRLAQLEQPTLWWATSGPDERESFHTTFATHVRCTCMVFAEYTLLTGIVVLTAGLALYALGVPLVQAFYLTKLFILLPVP